MQFSEIINNFTEFNSSENHKPQQTNQSKDKKQYSNNYSKKINKIL